MSDDCECDRCQCGGPQESCMVDGCEECGFSIERLLAKHRVNMVAAERAAIVARLRRRVAFMFTQASKSTEEVGNRIRIVAAVVDAEADVIERGEHHAPPAAVGDGKKENNEPRD